MPISILIRISMGIEINRATTHMESIMGILGVGHMELFVMAIKDSKINCLRIYQVSIPTVLSCSTDSVPMLYISHF